MAGRPAATWRRVLCLLLAARAQAFLFFGGPQQQQQQQTTSLKSRGGQPSSSTSSSRGVRRLQAAEWQREFTVTPEREQKYEYDFTAVDLVSTELALLRANQQFYAAFRSGDFDALCATLHPDECISVIHPGIPPLYGRKAVIQSWRSVLNAPPHIVASEPRVVQIADDIAWLHCFETLDGHNGLVRLAATNIFKRDSHGSWRIVLHHAGSCMI